MERHGEGLGNFGIGRFWDWEMGVKIVQFLYVGAGAYYLYKGAYYLGKGAYYLGKGAYSWVKDEAWGCLRGWDVALCIDAGA
jgi:hypothetical protein